MRAFATIAALLCAVVGTQGRLFIRETTDYQSTGEFSVTFPIS